MSAEARGITMSPLTARRRLRERAQVANTQVEPKVKISEVHEFPKVIPWNSSLGIAIGEMIKYHNGGKNY